MARCAGLAAAVLAAVLAAGCAPVHSSGSGAADGPGIVGLSHGTAGPLSFDYPATWALTPVGHPRHYETVLALLASDTASAVESCGPEYVPGMGAGCADAYRVPPGGVVIRLSQRDEPTPAARLVSMDVAAGWQPRTVAGQPAAYSPAYSDATTPADGSTVAWFVAGPGAGTLLGYAVVATVNGSDPDARAAVDALVASLRIAPTEP